MSRHVLQIKRSDNLPRSHSLSIPQAADKILNEICAFADIMQNKAQIQANQGMNPPPPPKTPWSPSHHSSEPRFGGRVWNDVPDGRKLYVLFNCPYAVSDVEIREFFAKSYGNVCQIQMLFMNISRAVIVFYSMSAVPSIVGDAYEADLIISGKRVLALRFGPIPRHRPPRRCPIVPGYDVRRWLDEPADRIRRGWEDVPDNRKLSVLFYSEYAVSEAEIREFFAKSYGNACRIQTVFMTETYAVIVFYSESAVQLIVGDAITMKFSINGKDVCALRFGPSNAPSPSPSPSHQYSQPRFGGGSGEDVPDDQKLLVPDTPWCPFHLSSQPRFGGRGSEDVPDVMFYSDRDAGGDMRFLRKVVRELIDKIKSQ